GFGIQRRALCWRRAGPQRTAARTLCADSRWTHRDVIGSRRYRLSFGRHRQQREAWARRNDRGGYGCGVTALKRRHQISELAPKRLTRMGSVSADVLSGREVSARG